MIVTISNKAELDYARQLLEEGETVLDEMEANDANFNKANQSDFSYNRCFVFYMNTIGMPWWVRLMISLLSCSQIFNGLPKLKTEIHEYRRVGNC